MRGTLLSIRTAYYYGGAIANYGTLTETNNTFTNNTANYYGGAISNTGGILTETNNIYTDNTAQVGGVFYNDRYGTVTGTNNTFNNNTATSNGGAIYNEGILNETNSTFINNTANNDGGAIYKDGISTVNFSRIVGNHVPDIYNGRGSVNAENNWWGSNFIGTNPLDAGIVKKILNIDFKEVFWNIMFLFLLLKFKNELEISF